LMTLGAVDFGVIVDAGVVMVENIYRQLARASQEGVAARDYQRIVFDAAREGSRPIVFAITIIISVYLPLFTLEGVEGRMFAPLALTFIFALLGALIISLTLIPVLCFWLLRGKIVEHHNPFLVAVRKAHQPLIERCMQRPRRTLALSLGALLVTLMLVPFMGT